jgi:hypothetical protein
MKDSLIGTTVDYSIVVQEAIKQLARLYVARNALVTARRIADVESETYL